jgi:multisubunit Na+/H+ antiporter MnhG subunit
VTDIQMTDVTLVPTGSAGAGQNRLERLTTEVRGLKVGRGRIAMGENTLALIGGVICPLGLVLVLVGWWGAARTPNLYEQVPYLISGGLFGLSLVVLGGFLYFAHWLTELIKETRDQSHVVATALERLEAAMVHQMAMSTAVQAPAAVAYAPAPVTAATAAVAYAAEPAAEAGARPRRRPLTASVTAPVVAPAATGLVATAKGTMAHRPECVVVAGKQGLRPVAEGEGLQPCKLCDSPAT